MCCVADRRLKSALVVVRETMLGLVEAPSLLLLDDSQPDADMGIVCLA